MHTPILAYPFIGFCVLLSLEDPLFCKYIVGFFFSNSLDSKPHTWGSPSSRREGTASSTALLLGTMWSNWRHGGMPGHLAS